MNVDIFNKIEWVCPSCGKSLNKAGEIADCPVCHQNYEWENNRISFIANKTLNAGKNEDNGLKDFFKKWPKFYYFILCVFGPVLFVGLSSKKFLKKFRTDGLVLNLGSGPKVLADSVINVDLFPYDGVDVQADVNNLPLAAGSVSRVVCDSLIEHVENPQKLVNEITRVLSSRGMAYFSVPFMFPFHASPDDFYRWTEAGFLKLFRDYEIVETGVRSGAFSAINSYLCYVFALLFSFGSRRLYWFFVNISMFLFFPIKFMDAIFYRLPFGSDMAAALYFVVKKK